MKTTAYARKLVKDILVVFRVCSLTEASLHAAMALPINDYEDAAQAASAIAEGLDAIVTRDKGGYANLPIPVFSPAEFMKQLD